MRLIRLSLIGLYLFLGLALLCLSMSSARSAVSDSQATYSEGGGSSVPVDIVPARLTQVVDESASYCFLNSDRNTKMQYDQCVSYFENLKWESEPGIFEMRFEEFLELPPRDKTGNIVISYCSWAISTQGNRIAGQKYSCAPMRGGGYYAFFKAEYSCPPTDNPDYSLPTSNPSEPDSEGKYCRKELPENPCTKLKGLNDSLQVTKYFVDKTGGSPACKDGCEMTRVAGNAWEYWTDENKVTWAVASYVYSGNECSDDYNYREVQSAEAPSSGQSTVPSSAASSAEPTAPSSAASSAGGTGSNPSSGSGTNTNPSGGSGTGNDSGCYGTNHGDVCNGASGSTGSGGGAGAGDGSGTPPASSATPASGGEGTFIAPKGSKDYLKDVFSSDAIKTVQSQRDATLTKINEKMAQIKALTNINTISVSGDISPDVKSVRGNDVDFSGKDIISKFSISWVFYFVTALICMDIILNRRKK